MANEEHLAVLKQGVKAWNDWREKNPEIKPNFSEADLHEADLSGANLWRAKLSNADLRGAALRGTDLSLANLKKAQISQEPLIDEKWRKVWEIVNQGAVSRDLSEADLSEADLSGTNLSRADLSSADLTEANLSRIQALGTNFEGVRFTGACLENWNINSETNLDDVICDYVYLKENQQERRPHDPNKNFASGEFTNLFQKALETVDLIFSDGIDWQAFLASFQKLQVSCGSDELSIQAIEKKAGGAFVIRVEVPTDANKAEVEKYLKREYEDQLKAIEETYRYQLNAKENEIALYRQQSADFIEIIKLQATRPIQNVIENQNLQGDRNMTEKRTIKMGDGHYHEDNRKIQTGGGDVIETIKGDNIRYGGEQKQSLAQAAADIQQLLEQLDKTYATDTTTGKMTVATEVIKKIDSNPTLTNRVLSALKAGSVSALDQLLDHPAASFVIGALSDWQNSKEQI